jgi:hypothetical protein
MIDRLIDRLPALLLLGILALAAQVALVELDEPQRLLAAVPATVLLVLYLRAGSRGGARR